METHILIPGVEAGSGAGLGWAEARVGAGWGRGLGPMCLNVPVVLRLEGPGVRSLSQATWLLTPLPGSLEHRRLTYFPSSSTEARQTHAGPCGLV